MIRIPSPKSYETVANSLGKYRTHTNYSNEAMRIKSVYNLEPLLETVHLDGLEPQMLRLFFYRGRVRGARRSKRSRRAGGDGAGIEPAFGERVIIEEHGAAHPCLSVLHLWST